MGPSVSILLLIGSVGAQDRLEGEAALADLPDRLQGVTVEGVYGYGLRGAGDVDGDGTADVWVDQSYGAAGGTALLYRGPLGGLLTESDATALVASGSADDGCGRIDGGFDLDGDAVPDGVLSCASGVYVLPGTLTGVVDLTAATAWWPEQDDGYQEGDVSPGIGLAAGDLTGDGTPDLVVHATLYSGEMDIGLVAVVPGPVAGELDARDAQAQLARGFIGAHTQIDAHTDVDGDGVADLLMSGVGANASRHRTDRLVLFLGPLDGRVTMAEAALRVHASGEGWTARVAGDTDGDGTPDLLLGAPYGPGGDERGAAFLIDGTDRGDEPTAAALATVFGAQDDDCVGRGVAGVDLDQDGFADVAVGAPGVASASDTDAGELDLWYGPMSGVLPMGSANLRLRGDTGGAGGAVDAPGDVDGDGFPDLLVAAPRWSDGASEVGAVFLVPGGG